MALMKFITVFDDEKQKLLYNEILKRYSISAYPPVYFSDGQPYVDYLNTDSVTYMRHLAESTLITGPDISVKVFLEAIKTMYDQGYSVVAIICPSRKYFPAYYKNAVTAANNFYRRKNIDLTTFRVEVMDSKAFAAGHLYFTLQLARLYNNSHCPTGIVIEDSKNFIAKTMVLSSSASKFGYENGKLSSFRIFGNRIFHDVKISDSTDYVKFNLFAKACAKYIKNAKAKYIISVGADCDFAGKIVGRIENILGFPPIATIQYGVNSTSLLGLQSLCVHIV